jgi:hypothetical protein
VPSRSATIRRAESNTAAPEETRSRLLWRAMVSLSLSRLWLLVVCVVGFGFGQDRRAKTGSDTMTMGSIQTGLLPGHASQAHADQAAPRPNEFRIQHEKKGGLSIHCVCWAEQTKQQQLQRPQRSTTTDDLFNRRLFASPLRRRSIDPNPNPPTRVGNPVLTHTRRHGRTDGRCPHAAALIDRCIRIVVCPEGSHNHWPATPKQASPSVRSVRSIFRARSRTSPHTYARHASARRRRHGRLKPAGAKVRLSPTLPGSRQWSVVQPHSSV